MKKLLFTLAAIVALSSLANTVQAADKDYQVTGPVVEVTDTYLVVKKGEANWQIARNASTKGATPKVGDKVTVYYSMTATEIEAKKAKAEKKEK